MSTTSKEQSPQEWKKTKMPKGQSVASEEAVQQQSGRREITGKVEKHAEVWEHAKNLRDKIKRLKDRVKDTKEIKEIDELLEKIQDHFSEFPKESMRLQESGEGTARTLRELKDRRKIAELKLARLNQRMVRLLEKFDQPLGKAFAQYRDFKPVLGVEQTSDSTQSDDSREETDDANYDDANYDDAEGEARDEKVAERLMRGMGFSDELAGVKVEDTKADRGVGVPDVKSVQLPKDFSEHALGDSEIGGVNIISAGEKKNSEEKLRGSKFDADEYAARWEQIQKSGALDRVRDLEKNNADVWVKRTSGEWQKGKIVDIPGTRVVVEFVDTDGKKKGKAVDTKEFLKWQDEREDAIEVPLDPPSEEKVGSHEAIPDSIQITAGRKTYEFGWHEQVVYTTAKGKKIECIVLGKSTDENKPGLILKDLEKGKVFALGADAVAQRVHVSGGETVPLGVENNEANSVQSTEDDDIFGLKDQPRQEETKWPSSYYTPEVNSLDDTRAGVRREEKAVLEKKEKERREAEQHKAQELSELLGQAGKSTEDGSLFLRTDADERGDNNQEIIDRLVADGSIEKINTLLKNKSEVWVQENGAWYHGVIQDMVGTQVGVVATEENGEKKYLYVDAEEFLGMQDRAKKMLKYKKELDLPSVMVDTEFLARPDTIIKGEIVTPSTERKVVPDVPLVSIDTSLPVRERKTYPEVSEKKALQMIQSVSEEFEKTWKGMRMMTTEKQKTGWLQSTEVEREMTVVEKKEQLEAWLDMVEQAFDSLDKQKYGTHMEKPVLMWYQAQALIRRLENELRYIEETNTNEEFDNALEALGSTVDAGRARLREKRSSEKKSWIAQWAMKTTLAALGAFAIGNATNNRIEDVSAVSERYAETGEKKYELYREESTGDAQRDMVGFVTDINRMMTEYALSITPVAIDSRLTSQIKDKISGKVPGLAGAEIASDGKSVTLVFEDNTTAQSRPEKVTKTGKKKWVLTGIPKEDARYGARVVTELRETLGDVKKKFPDIFNGTASESEARQITRTVAEAEKRAQEVESLVARDSKERKQLEEVQSEIAQIKPKLESVSREVAEEVESDNLELPADVFARFGARITEDPEAGRLAEEWLRVGDALKAAQKAGDKTGVDKYTIEVKKIVEEIKSKY